MSEQRRRPRAEVDEVRRGRLAEAGEPRPHEVPGPGRVRRSRTVRRHPKTTSAPVQGQVQYGIRTTMSTTSTVAPLLGLPPAVNTSPWMTAGARLNAKWMTGCCPGPRATAVEIAPVFPGEGPRSAPAKASGRGGRRLGKAPARGQRTLSCPSRRVGADDWAQASRAPRADHNGHALDRGLRSHPRDPMTVTTPRVGSTAGDGTPSRPRSDRTENARSAV